MSFPLPPEPPVLMVCLKPLRQETWAGYLAPIAVGDAFWAEARSVSWLVADGYAENAPAGTVAPPVEPRYTAHGSPGFGAGTSNSSH